MYIVSKKHYELCGYGEIYLLDIEDLNKKQAAKIIDLAREIKGLEWVFCERLLLTPKMKNELEKLVGSCTPIPINPHSQELISSYVKRLLKIDKKSKVIRLIPIYLDKNSQYTKIEEKIDYCCQLTLHRTYNKQGDDIVVKKEEELFASLFFKDFLENAEKFKKRNVPKIASLDSSRGRYEFTITNYMNEEKFMGCKTYEQYCDIETIQKVINAQEELLKLLKRKMHLRIKR